MDDMSIISAKDINDTRNLQTKASFSFEVIHACIKAQEAGLQSGMRLCIMPGPPTHLEQELNVRTVYPPPTTGLSLFSLNTVTMNEMKAILVSHNVCAPDV